MRGRQRQPRGGGQGHGAESHEVCQDANLEQGNGMVNDGLSATHLTGRHPAQEFERV